MQLLKQLLTREPELVALAEAKKLTGKMLEEKIMAEGCSPELWSTHKDALRQNFSRIKDEVKAQATPLQLRNAGDLTTMLEQVGVGGWVGMYVCVAQRG